MGGFGRPFALLAAGVALFGAGAAVAGVDLRRIVLKPGQCVTVAKVRVCAAKARPAIVRTVTSTVRVPPTTVTTPPTTATVTAPPVTVTVPPITVTVITTPTPRIAFADGTYRVGPDIEPGTYRTTANTDFCYWARLRGFGGTLDEIIASDIGPSPRIATIAPTDVGFRSSGCGGWAKIG